MTDEELKAKMLELPYEERKSFLCLNCLECCNWIIVPTHIKETTRDSEFIKFYVEARGFVLLKKWGRLCLGIKTTCPNLTESGCAIYMNRPYSCRQYDGRLDPLPQIRDKCKWNLL